MKIAENQRKKEKKQNRKRRQGKTTFEPAAPVDGTIIALTIVTAVLTAYFIQNFYLFYDRRIGTDTGCARCRRIERAV